MHPLDTLKILVVEDNPDLAETIIDFLESMGATVDFAADGLTGLHLMRSLKFDVVLLDVMLPGMNGNDLCREFRETENNATPVIMLTARDTLSDKLLGFDSGADDYLVKPFDLPELVARIRALHKRHSRDLVAEQLVVGNLQFDTGTREVTRNGLSLTLSPLGYTILELLMKNAPNMVTREELEQALWGDSPPRSDALRSQIYKLRKVIDRPFDKPMLHTVAGTGFRLGEE